MLNFFLHFVLLIKSFNPDHYFTQIKQEERNRKKDETEITSNQKLHFTLSRIILSV